MKFDKSKLTIKDCVAIYEYVYDGGPAPRFFYDFYMDDMPYGVAKARDGDPDQWYADHVITIEEDFAEQIEIGKMATRCTKCGDPLTEYEIKDDRTLCNECLANKAGL